MTTPSPFQNSVPITAPIPVPTPDECDGSSCQPHQCSKGGERSECPCSCDCSKKVRLHKKDGEKIAKISEEIATLAEKLAVLDAVSSTIKAVSSDQIDQALYIRDISQNLKLISDSLGHRNTSQTTQTKILQNISRSINSVADSLVNNPPKLILPSDTISDIKSVSTSLKTISNTQNEVLSALKNRWPLVLTILLSALLLPFVFKLVDSLFPPPPAPGSPTGAALTICPNSCSPACLSSCAPAAACPTPCPSATPTLPIPTLPAPPLGRAVICSSADQCLYVRQFPNLSATIISKIPCNTPIVQITGAAIDRDGETWAPVQYQTADGRAISGWSVRRFLSS